MASMMSREQWIECLHRLALGDWKVFFRALRQAEREVGPLIGDFDMVD